MVFETQPEQVREAEEKPPAERKEDERPEERLELDNVNKHECMKNLKRCVDRMAVLFGSQWEADRSSMPPFMQALLAEVRRPDASLNTRIFILKIVVNQ